MYVDTYILYVYAHTYTLCLTELSDSLASLLQTHADAGPAAGASEEAQACVHKLQTQVIETPLFLLMVYSAPAAASLLLQMDDPFRLETPLLLVMMY